MTAIPFALTTDSHAITTLTIEPNQGPMVMLDELLIQRLDATFKLVPKNSAGLILASGSPRVFIAGADLKSIESLDHVGLDRYLAYGQRVFAMLCQLPCPTVAAINGAALGGGLELAMHCDGLVGVAAPVIDGKPKPYPIGLPEAGLAICPGWGGTNLLPARVDPLVAIERTCAGKPFTVDEAIAAGLFDAVAPDVASLSNAAAAWLQGNRSIHSGRNDSQPLRWIGRVAGGLKAKVMAAAEQAAQGATASTTDQGRACLAAVAAGLDGGWQAALDVERRELNRLRSEPAGKAAIRAFFDKAGKK